MSFYREKGLKTHLTSINQYSILSCISLKLIHINQYINIKEPTWGLKKLLRDLYVVF